MYRAEADPLTSPAKLRRLRERCAQPKYDLLRHLAENRIGKAVTYIERKNLWYDIRYKKYAPVFLGQVKPRMRFWTAALEEAQLPPARLPEVAMCGRSNSGKSTLVNYLCGHHAAHVKREPGSTTEIVFWQIGRPPSLCLVDLPGYGFATSTEAKRLQWTEFTLWYVRSRKNLARVLVLLDARACLKPVDREMISYLERHSVPWQAVVTKCDKVTRKVIAKRMTLLEEELKAFRKMVAPPIPVSALKMKGMEQLRESLDNLKVRKEVIKDGIRRRVYDLLELRRIRRLEKAQRRREAKAEKAAKDAAGQEQAAAAEASATSADEADGTSDGPNLHSVLDDWGFDVGGEPGEASRRGRESGRPAAADGPRPIVAEAHYDLGDRDSIRVNSFMDGLFPDLSESAARTFAPASPGGTSAASASGLRRRPVGSGEPEPPPWHLPFGAGGGAAGPSLGGGPRRHHLPLASTEDLRGGLGEEPASDSDSDSASGSEDEPFGQAQRRSPSVMRFDPAPAMPKALGKSPERGRRFEGLFGGGAANEAPGRSSGSTSPFPGLPRAPVLQADGGVSVAAGGGGRSGAGRAPSRPEEVVGLRQRLIRPTAERDIIYEPDDFTSAEDRAAAVRRFAPPAPSAENRGALLAEARKRYEREWAMELEDVDQARQHASDTAGAASPRPSSGAVAAAALLKRGQSAVAAAGAQPQRASAAAASGGVRQRKLIDRTGAKAGYITKVGNKRTMKGIGLYKVLGRPPARILKRKNQPDAAKVLKLSNRQGRRRNVGSGLEWEEAQEKWINWYRHNSKKSRTFHKVTEAGSPRLEDVEAEYEERRERRFGRGRGRGRGPSWGGGRAGPGADGAGDGGGGGGGWARPGASSVE